MNRFKVYDKLANHLLCPQGLLNQPVDDSAIFSVLVSPNCAAAAADDDPGGFGLHHVTSESVGVTRQ
jgi:hypothetical protein